MKVTWYGNASIRVEDEGASLLFDPFVPMPGASYSLSLEDFLPAPVVLITHGHLDHAQSVPALAQTGAEVVYATAAPCKNLGNLGVPQENLRVIKPGCQLSFDNALGKREVTVTVRCGKHIHFDTLLVLRTILSPQVLRYRKNASALLANNKIFTEDGETVVYEVSDGNKLITLLGSLSLANDESYALNPDLLILPYQGNSRLLPIALSIVEKLAPRAVMLDHFDDAFPPISRAIDVAPFVEAMARDYSDIPVIVPQKGVAYAV